MLAQPQLKSRAEVLGHTHSDGQEDSAIIFSIL